MGTRNLALSVPELCRKGRMHVLLCAVFVCGCVGEKYIYGLEHGTKLVEYREMKR